MQEIKKINLSLIEHLDNYLELITYGFTNPMPDSNEGPWKITAKDVINGKINYDTARKTTIDSFENDLTPKSKPKINDILLTKDGTLGRLAIVDQENICVNQSVAVLRPNKKIIPQFLYYLLSSPYYQKTMLNDSDGSVLKHIYITRVKKMDVQIPDLTHQKKIIQILEFIDNKIDVLIKLNKNLDELCHSLFKYYFIDFIPFCDDDFIDSDIGEIPKEWSITTVGNILDCKLGGTPSRSNESYWGGSIAWINSGKVNDFRIIEPSEYITEKGLKKSATKLLPAKTTVIAITGATLGQISLLEIDSCANQSVIGIIPNINYPYEFVYPLISSILIDLLKHQTGGAQQHINKNNVESFKIICPPAEIISEYKTIVSPIYSKISDNCFEIEKLQKLRDTLLPKLMSGEIDVSKINCDLIIVTFYFYFEILFN